MDHLNGLVLRIEEGVKSLQSELDRYRSELNVKNEELDALRKENSDLRKTNSELEEAYSKLRLAKAIGKSSGSDVEARRRMNELVREIDKCIAMLNG